ncbi:hypothetical protein OO013_09430 [Mangrovivirga sp. M17]|uniref:DUF4168 domain-containing protein n=1 Tax=Mangrovivirga halotolerans TaxID=2993936 RepID=A0ABT3RQL8_9BACT|nr:hypothetical protein [Mangrovivirga halotolerans]MCX2744086.1 hypothetical protein [Mangrovivirga halotolerans]
MNLRTFLSVGMLMLFFSFGAVAQDDEVTTEDLYQYALLNVTVDQMKAEISDVINDMIKNQEGIDGKRYKELAGAYGDDAKLAEIGAKDFEIKFIEVIEKEKSDRIDAIKTVNQILATKMMGDRGKKYKAVKAAVKSDDAVKAEYEAIFANIQNAQNTEEAAEPTSSN